MGNIVFIITFYGMLVISTIVLLDINFEKIFKGSEIVVIWQIVVT